MAPDAQRLKLSRLMIDAIGILTQHAATTHAAIEREMNALADAPSRLVEAMRYSLLAGGKRLRPALVLETARAMGGVNDDAIAAAVAIELIHTFSLVHDDLPAMDDDDLRRGRPTNHKVFGEAMAILAGDAMVSLAFEILATRTLPHHAAAMVRELAIATGPIGMIGGQVLDIEGEGRSLELEGLQNIHRRKTGALITAAARLGGIAVDVQPEPLDALTRFGQHVGLAFQIADDVLDETATTQQLGKASNKDASRGKNTFPALLGLEVSRTRAREEVEAAIDAIAHLGDGATGLRLLAQFAIERTK